MIWSSSSRNGERNLEHGLATQTWGFRENFAQHGRPYEYVLFGRSFSDGSPRKPAALWRAGVADLVLCLATVPPYVGTAPHWPDEQAAHTVIYPYRLGFSPITSLAEVTLGDSGPLGPTGSEALRQAAIGNRPTIATVDLEALYETAHLSPVSGGETDLSQTPGAVSAKNVQPEGRNKWSSNAALNTAVERHAVRVAIERMTSEGWIVRELGKPFDLVCTRADGQEKHVEVKGTTGAGADVSYTPNEVRHFRNCPFGADLIVVRDIVVDPRTTPYGTSGGELLHIRDYTAPARDLQATGWLGRVEGW